MNEREAECLANYRVEGYGNTSYLSLAMSPEERITRRRFIRHALSGLACANASNEVIDGMRVDIDHNICGVLYEDEEGRLFYRPNTKLRSEDIQFRRDRAMIPKEYQGKMGDDFDWTRYGADIEGPKSIINNFITGYNRLEANGMGLYIYSKTKGSGKTMLSCCVLNELSKRYPGSVKFINVLDFLDMTKKGFNYDNPDVEALYICKVLVIDDIGVQMDKEWVNTVLYRLINNRYNDKKVTIYTSNTEAESLNMDDRIIDRIINTSYMVRLPEVSVRKMITDQKKEKLMNEATKKAP